MRARRINNFLIFLSLLAVVSCASCPEDDNVFRRALDLPNGEQDIKECSFLNGSYNFYTTSENLSLVNLFGYPVADKKPSWFRFQIDLVDKQRWVDIFDSHGKHVYRSKPLQGKCVNKTWVEAYDYDGGVDGARNVGAVARVISKNTQGEMVVDRKSYGSSYVFFGLVCSGSYGGEVRGIFSRRIEK